MSLTALAFLAVYFAGLGLAFFRPIFGLMAYLWAFYQYPESRWWSGDVPSLRWSLIAAAVTLVAERLYTLRDGGRDSTSERTAEDSSDSTTPWYYVGGLVWLTAFSAWIWIQTPWALNRTWHFDGAILFSKYVVLFFLLFRLIRDTKSAELFGWAHVAGCVLWGWLAWSADVNGRMELSLGPGVEDANGAGLHLGTGVAFAGLLLFGSRYKLRWLVIPAIPFILNGVILTASRGSMLGLIAAGIIALLLGPRKKRAITVGGVLLGAVLFFILAGSEVFWDRMATLRPSEGEEVEASAASRVVIADANWQMFLDHPVGVGHRGNLVLSPDYIPLMYLSPDVNLRAAHNTILAVLVDHGAIGAILYVGLHLWAALKLIKMKRLDKQGLPQELGTLRAAAGATLAALIVCGFFSNYIKAEVGIWSFALVAILDSLCTQWVAEQKAARVTTSAVAQLPAMTAAPVDRRPRGNAQPVRTM